MRAALLLEYDGGGFVGWQRQENGLAVQQVLEEAASRLAHGAPVASAVAGRTDAGVHAEGQVALLDLPSDFGPERLRDALNFHLKPHPVVVLCAAPAPEGWNPRFSAIGRALPLPHPQPPRRGRRCWRAGCGMSSARSIAGDAAAARRRCSAGTISPRSAPACARHRARCSTLDRLDVTRARRHDGESSPRRAASCTIRCATWSAR